MANPFAEKYCDDEELFPPVRSENESSRIKNQNNKNKTNCTCSACLIKCCQCLFFMLNCCGTRGPCTPSRMRYWAIFLGIAFTLISTILISVDLHRNGTEPHILAWVSGGMFVLMAIPLALYEIFMHLVWYVKPESQRYIIRIIWMVPVYAIESWLALRYKDYALYMQAAREFYEAFVILSFLQYLLNHLGSTDEERASLIKAEAQSIEHSFPFSCCVDRWEMGHGKLQNSFQHK